MDFSTAPLIGGALGAIAGTAVGVGIAAMWLPTLVAIPVGGVVGVFVGGYAGVAIGMLVEL